MIGRLDPLLTDATKEFETTPEDNPYKNNLKTAIDRLKDAMDKLNAKKLLLDAEALRLDMQAKEENAKEEERNKDKERTKANPLEKLTPIRAKFIAIENQINEDMRLNPDNYTEAEKLNIEKLKPLDMAIILKNMDDELLTR